MSKKTEISIIALPIALVFASALYLSSFLTSNITVIKTNGISKTAFSSLLIIKPSKNGLASMYLNTYSDQTVKSSQKRPADNPLGAIGQPGIDLASEISIGTSK